MGKLIKCSGCGAKISKKAKACPQCGEPVSNGVPGGMLIIAAIVAGLYFYGNYAVKKSNEENKAQEQRIQQQRIQQQKLHKEKVQKEQNEYDAKYYKQSREIIIKDINQSMQKKDYNRVIYRTTKYLSYKGKDDDIMKLNQEANTLLEAERQAKIKEANEKRKKQILAQLKTISASEYEKNKNLYQELLKFEPENKKYQDKVKYYTEQIAKAKKEQADRLVKFGKPPMQSAWDGSYYVVENYLEKVARNPDSVDVESCSEVMYNDYGWVVRCTWRGENGFGGMSVQTNRFTIRHDKVLAMD